MRTSNYLKKLAITNKTRKIIWGILGAGLLAGMIAFFSYFSVENVEVMGSSHYSAEEIKAKVLRGPFASNSVLAPMLYTKKDKTGMPFVDGVTVTQINRNTICISVKEKQPVGCISYLDSYIYFDRNGIFIEGSRTRDESVPYFDGIQVKHVVLNEKLPIKGNTILNTAVALSTIFRKNQMVPDHIQFDEAHQISLVYGEVVVQLGKDENLEEKMSRVASIFPSISGKKGILHMESVTTDKNTFEASVEEGAEDTWSGGYDENGEYTGEGEYDKYGNHVGAKPLTDLDYALANWHGGYDEVGEYTGEGEYDENGNYTGPKPTKESMAANGDWKGGYLEDGSYVGYGQLDREGNYVGPNPNDSEESSDEDYDSDYDEGYDYDEDYDGDYDEDYDDSYDGEYYE